MKVDYYRNSPIKFEPIKIEIDIETIEELNFLYARINAPINEVKKYRYNSSIKEDNGSVLFNCLENICKRMIPEL